MLVAVNDYELKKKCPLLAKLTGRALGVVRFFGLNCREDDPPMLIEPMRLSVGPGQVVFITGASGSGKSQMLGLITAGMRRQVTTSGRVFGWEAQVGSVLCGLVSLSNISIPARQLVADMFGDLPLYQMMRLMSLAGLADARLMTRRFGQLSEGEKYRLRLAVAMLKGPEVMVADEFAGNLDVITAAALSERVRQWADRTAMTFILASSRDDLIDDLRPDTVVMRYPGGGASIYHPNV